MQRVRAVHSQRVGGGEREEVGRGSERSRAIESTVNFGTSLIVGLKPNGAAGGFLHGLCQPIVVTTENTHAECCCCCCCCF